MGASTSARHASRNLAFYRRLGYEIVGEHRHDGFAEVTWLGLRKPVGV